MNNENKMTDLINRREAQTVKIISDIKEGKIKPEALEDTLIQLKAIGGEIGSLLVWRDSARRVDNLVRYL